MNIGKLRQVDFGDKNPKTKKTKKIINEIHKLLAMPDDITLMTRWNVLSIAAVICVFFIIIAAPVVGGNDGLQIQVIAMICMVTILLIICVLLENKASRKWLFMVTLYIAGGFCLLYMGAVNNFPEFIRSIKGENFTMLWWVYTVVVYICALIMQFVCIKCLSNKYVDELKKQYYSDGDIMLLNEYSRYRLAGYYLIKGKFDGIFNFARCKDAHKNTGMQVYLDESVTDDDRDFYCEDNPEIGRIVEYLKEKKDFGEDYIVVEKVINYADTQSEIRSTGGFALSQIVAKADRCKNILCGIAIFMAYYVAFTKMIMGMHNGKPVENLVFFGILLSVFMTLIFIYLDEAVVVYSSDDWLWKPIFDANIIHQMDFEQMLHQVLVDGSDMTKEQKDDLLRYYATNEYSSKLNWLGTPESDYEYVYSILNAVIAAEKRDAELAAAERERQKASMRGSGHYYGGGGFSGGGSFGGGGCGGCGG